MSFRTSSTTNKLLLSAAAVGVAGSMAGLGTFATFTDTQTGSTAIDSGVVAMTIGADTTSANRLSVAAVNIVPGDTIQRAVDLGVASTTTSTLADIKLTTTGTGANLLTSDATSGLQVAIEKCSAAWTESAVPYTYTCASPALKTVVLASRPIIGADVALSSLGLAAGSVNNLVVTATLPSTAGNTFQNLASTITYSFTGTQRAGTPQ